MKGFTADVALALGGAGLMALAAPPINMWPLGLLAWVPLALISSGATTRRASLLGWLQGVVAQASVLASLPEALYHVGGASLLASELLAGALVSFEGLRTGFVAAMASYACRKGWPIAAAFPCALVVAEGLFPMFFPWTSSLLFHGVPVLLQLAEWGGALALTAWVSFLDASLVMAARAGLRNRSGATAWSAVAAATIASVWALGGARMRVIDTRSSHAPVVRVGLVQQNVRNPVDTGDALKTYRDASERLHRGSPADVFVWPEAAIDRPLDRREVTQAFASRIFSEEPSSGGLGLTVPIIAGVVTRRAVDSSAHLRVKSSEGILNAPEPSLFNSAVLVTPRRGVEGIYDKQDLVAFGEYIPLESTLPFLRTLLPSAGRFVHGTGPATFLVGGHRVLPLICYEDIIPARVRASVAHVRPELLVNLTSDAWFSRSRVPALHLALASLRSVEHRRYLVHATNTGDTAVVDPTGRIVATLPPDRAASITVSVRWIDSEQTAYERFGDFPLWIALFALVSMLVRRRMDSDALRGAMSVSVPPIAFLRSGGRSRTTLDRGKSEPSGLGRAGSALAREWSDRDGPPGKVGASFIPAIVGLVVVAFNSGMVFGERFVGALLGALA